MDESVPSRGGLLGWGPDIKRWLIAVGVGLLAVAIVGTAVFAKHPVHPVRARLVVLERPVIAPRLNRAIGPGRGEPPISEAQAVDRAWQQMGEVHPASVVAVYVSWNKQPMWVVSFQGGDICPPVTGYPGADVAGQCVGNTWNVKIDATTGAWVDTFAGGPATSPGASSPAPSMAKILRGG
jgi:hypothetical protein